jgi:hypothetical protein
MLLHKKQLFVNNHTNEWWLGILLPKMIIYYLHVGVLMSISYISGNWLGDLGWWCNAL